MFILTIEPKLVSYVQVSGSHMRNTNPLAQFFVDGHRLLNRCTKPARKEFTQLAKATATGVLFMGGMGVVVKLAAATLFGR